MHAYTTTVVPADYVDYAAYHWGLPTRSKIIRAHQQWFEEGIPLVVRIESNQPTVLRHSRVSGTIESAEDSGSSRG